MDITEVRIKLMEDSDDRLQAFCSITFDDCFVVRDLKIIEGASGPFVAMPSRKLTMHCHQCGTKNHLRAAYCNNCGSRLKEDRAARDSEGALQAVRRHRAPHQLRLSRDDPGAGDRRVSSRDRSFGPTRLRFSLRRRLSRLTTAPTPTSTNPPLRRGRRGESTSPNRRNRRPSRSPPHVPIRRRRAEPLPRSEPPARQESRADRAQVQPPERQPRPPHAPAASRRSGEFLVLFAPPRQRRFRSRDFLIRVIRVEVRSP